MGEYLYIGDEYIVDIYIRAINLWDWAQGGAYIEMWWCLCWCKLVNMRIRDSWNGGSWQDCGRWRTCSVYVFILFNCFDMFDCFAFIVYLICTVYILYGLPCGVPSVAVPPLYRCLQAQAHTWIAASRT